MPLTFATTTQERYAPDGTKVAGANDLFLGLDGNLQTATGIDAVLYACANAAKTILGEMVLLVDQGLPNFELVWVGVPNLAQWQAALQVTLEAVAGVVQVDALTVSVDADNSLHYTAIILTEYGSGTLNG
jgi:hypothetical protein